MANKLLLRSRMKKLENTDKKRVAILGYTGAAVDLRDMGFPERVVYNMQGFSVEPNIPYYEEHRTLMGHTIENTKDDKGELFTIAEHSVENERSTHVYNAIQNGEDYEASMGVEVDLEHVMFIEEGTVTVNNHLFQAPIFVANRGTVTEMTATKSGRDGNTSIHKLSQDYEDGKAMLMKIKNSRLAVNNADPDEALAYLDNYKDAPKVLIENAKKDKWDEDKFKVELENHKEPPSPPPSPPVSLEYLLDYVNHPTGKTLIENARKEKWTEDKFKVELNKIPSPGNMSFDWLWGYIDDPVARPLIANARKEGWDEERMKTQIEVAKIKNAYPGIPGVHLPSKTDGEEGFTAKLAMSLGVTPKTIEEKLGKKAADYANDNPGMGFTEGLMYCANANQGRFNGHSDKPNMAKYVKNLVVHNGFSTIDYPNLMHRVTQWKLEEKWAIEAPQSPQLCKEVNNPNFQTRGHLKARGGKMWEGFDDEGKIKHGSFGKEDTYTTDLNTIAQIVTFPRQVIIDDDIGWIEDSLDLMLEGAIMVPDYLFVNLWYRALAAGVLDSGTTHVTLALDETNLSTLYNTVRRRYTEKEAQKDDKTVNGRFQTRWWLVHTVDLEETAWNLIKQDRIVNDTTANTKTGDKNYWYNRVDLLPMDNLDNTTYHASARNDTWGLIPQRERFRPFYISYLQRKSRPTTERVELPSDELGFGVRGYWDINEGYRPVENDMLQACGISIPTT